MYVALALFPGTLQIGLRLNGYLPSDSFRAYGCFIHDIFNDWWTNQSLYYYHIPAFTIEIEAEPIENP